MTDLIQPTISITPDETPNALALKAIKELQESIKRVSDTLSYTSAMVAADGFKFLSPEKRKSLMDELISHSDHVDDMTSSVLKLLRKIKRERLRDDDRIAELVIFEATSKAV